MQSSRPDLIFHLASRVQGGRELSLVEPTLRDILIGTVNVLTAASEGGCARVVLAGSMEEPAVGESDAPSSPYAAAKSAASVYARLFQALYSLPVVSLRIFMVYGPGQQEPRLIPYVINSFARGEQPRLTSGTRAIDWVYVDDVVEALVAAGVAQGGVEGSFDVGSGTSVPIRELVGTVAAKMGTSLEPIFGAIPDRPLETSRAADVRRAEEVLGWRPATGLEDGLDRTIAWLGAAGGTDPAGRPVH